jgi:hypothetical protein
VLTGLLSAYRLAPAALTIGAGSNIFALSFRNLAMVFDALVVGRTARFAQETEGWWEFDTYIGLIGFALLCAGAMPHRRSASYLNTFYPAVIVLFALSIGGLYESTLFRLPGFVSERVVTRFAVVPALVLVLIGCVRVDGWLRAARGRARPIAVAGAVALSIVLVAELVLKAAAWRPVALVYPPPVESGFVMPQAVDPAYLWSVWIGFAVSIVALGAMLARINVHRLRASTLAS